jgi:hypothetical protein
MRTACVALLVFTLASASVPARADWASDDPRPKSGLGGIIVGYGGLGFALLNTATLPVCFAEFYPAEAENLCLGTSAALIAGGLVAGATGLTLGYKRRAVYKEWRARRTPPLTLQTADVGLLGGGPGLRLRFSF